MMSNLSFLMSTVHLVVIVPLDLPMGDIAPITERMLGSIVRLKTVVVR